MQAQPLNEDDLYYTDAPVGDVLRFTREHYHQSLFDVEKALRIRASLIEAIEKSEYDKLPGKVYAIGFIRSYAEYLGLNPDRVVDLYKDQVNGNLPDPVLHLPAPASDKKLPDVKVLIACAVLFLSVTWLWNNAGKLERPVQDIPPYSKAALTAEPIDTLIGPTQNMNVEEKYSQPAQNTLNPSQ